MNLDDLSRLLVIASAVNIVSTSVLVAAALRHRWAALQERASVAIILAVVSFAAAVLGLQRLMVIELPTGVPLAILAIGLLLVSVPSVVWLVAFLAGRFDEADTSGEKGRP